MLLMANPVLDNIGICKSQPEYEGYICSGSLYLASTAFQPLGIPSDDEFWVRPAKMWTQYKVWNSTI